MKRLFVLLGVIALVLSGSRISAGTFVQFRTVLGDLDVELYDQDKPVTVKNFLRYVQSGSYSNLFLHRCLPGFVVQGGGFTVTNPVSTAEFGNFGNVTTFGAITNEYLVGTRYSNTYGTIAMAKVKDAPHSATSQWFFNLADNGSILDNQNGGFTVFGRVVGGTNVLQNFNGRQKLNADDTQIASDGVVDLRWWYGFTNATAGIFSDLPVTYRYNPPTTLPAYPRYDQLIYVDVSLVNVGIKPVIGGQEISWNSVSNRVQHVEFTTNFPPVWQSLVSTNGDGSRFTITDTASENAQRFYRVRVEY